MFLTLIPPTLDQSLPGPGLIKVAQDYSYVFFLESLKLSRQFVIKALRQNNLKLKDFVKLLVLGPQPADEIIMSLNEKCNILPQ